MIEKIPTHIRLSLITIILSLVSGLSAISFMVLVNFIYSRTILSYSLHSRNYFLLASLVVVLLTSLIAGLLLKFFSPEAAGSGIPQVKAAYWKEMGDINLRAGIIKYLAGAITIGGGTSLGREGPSVFLGSAISTNLSGLFGFHRRRRRGPNVIGASAGLAAAFNAPLASITFIIEEILGDLNSRHLGSVILASVFGAFTVQAIIGRQPAFQMASVENVSWNHYLVVPVATALAAFLGLAFQKLTLFLRTEFRRHPFIPLWAKPMLGGLTTWLIGISIFVLTGKLGVFGLGYQDLSAIMRNDFPWEVAGLLVLGKLVATSVSYASGGCGGIFAPTLFLGGMTGFFTAGIFSSWLSFQPADYIVLAAVGMTSCLGAVVRAPLTSLLIVFEMTHQFELVPSLLLATLISQGIARLAGQLNFYEALLIQDGHELHKIKPPLDIRSWQNLPVSAIANYHPVSVNSLEKEDLRKMIEKYPYNNFPFLQDGQVAGVVNREKITKYLTGQENIEIWPVAFCYEDEPLREMGNRFLESPANLLLVKRRLDDQLVVLVTLHDIIRAQISIED
ncbi:MAG: chloride channel protein [Candidatus Saccharicenans sp.]|uniref:chloride channel protein n=1 Tax=Candidatus Saccharicenans sp. TaxID=2819258 RepID=UPI004049F795